jgi:hypothetical protein
MSELEITELSSASVEEKVRSNLTVQKGGEAALGHVIEDEQLLPLGAEVVGSD